VRALIPQRAPHRLQLKRRLTNAKCAARSPGQSNSPAIALLLAAVHATAAKASDESEN